MHSLQRLQAVAAWIGASLMPLLAIVVMFNVLARALFSHAPSWPFEVSIFIFGIMTLLAGGQVLRDNEHVAVDILPRRSGPRLGQALHILAMGAIIFVCTFLIIDGTSAAIESTRIRERSIFQTAFNPQIWWFRWMIPVAAALILVEAVRQLFSPRPHDDASRGGHDERG